MKNHQKVGGALLATAVVALLSVAAGTSAQMTAQVIEDAKAPIFGVPALSPEQCGETIQNSTTEMIIAFSSCLATSSASEACCSAIENTFAFKNAKFGGCLCHPVLMNTVMQLAEGFLPGSNELIPTVMRDCVAPDGDFASAFAFYGQTEGSEQCDPSVVEGVDVDAVDSDILGELAPTVGAQSREAKVDNETEIAIDTETPDNETEIVTETEAPARNMDQALTVFSVLAVEDCGANLLEGQSELIGALTPCIIAEAPTQTCCSAIENVFKPTNENYGGCLCHKEVMDGIFLQAEGFLPGSTSLIQNAFKVCTNDFGSQFSFHGQEVGHVSCSSDVTLSKPSMNQASDSGSAAAVEENENLIDQLGDMFASPKDSNAASGTATAAVSALVAVLSVACTVLF